MPQRSRLARFSQQFNKVKKDKKLVKFLIIEFLTIVITGIVAWQVFSWFKTNTVVFHAPMSIKFYTPVRLVNREAYQQELETEKNLKKAYETAIYQYEHPETLPKCESSAMEKVDPQKFWDVIFLYESTNDTSTTGLNAYCKSKGKSNPIGYSPSTKFCFNSLEEAKLFIPYWLSRHTQGLTFRQALCLWNEGDPDHDGVIRSDCPYALGNLSEAN